MARASKPKPIETLPPVMDGSAGVYLFCGDELFLRRLCLNQLISATLGLDVLPSGGSSGDGAMAVSQFDGSEATLAGVLDELRTLPFLSSRRVVVVNDADVFIGRYRQAMEDYLAKQSPTGVLVLLTEAERSNTKLFQAVAKLRGIVACQQPEQNELARWVRDRARDAYAKTIDYETSGLLADLIGQDLDRLDSELAKLATYLEGGRKTITVEDVDELVANQRLHDAFELTGAIAGKDAAAAVVRWNDMLAKDADAPYRSVALIAWQVRQLVRARSLRRRGLSRDEVLGKLRVPFSVRQRFVEQVSRFSEGRLRRLLAELVELDLAAKTGGAPPERSIERFIVKACQAEKK